MKQKNNKLAQFKQWILSIVSNNKVAVCLHCNSNNKPYMVGKYYYCKSCEEPVVRTN